MSERSNWRSLLPVSLVGVLLGSLLMAGCAKPKPSPEFERAHAQFSALYGKNLDDAYTMPEMDGVLTLLDQVPAKSRDAQAAAELRTRIQNGREEAAKLRQDRANAKAEASKSSPALNTGSSSDGDGAAPAGADAAPAEPTTTIATGMPEKDFESAYGGCFTVIPDIFVTGKGFRRTWQLKDIANCRDRNPGFDSKYVVFEDAKLLGFIEKSEVKPKVIDGGAKQ